MLLLLILIPLIGIFAISATSFNTSLGGLSLSGSSLSPSSALSINKSNQIKTIALSTSIVNLAVSLIVFILFHFSNNSYQFVQEYHQISTFDLYLGVDGMSIYFVLLTTIIMPISLLSN